MEETMSCICSRPGLKVNNKDFLPCFINLQKYKCLKEKNYNSSWTLHYTNTGLKVYLSLANEKLINFAWNKPVDLKCSDVDNSPYLTLQEVKVICL